MIRGCMAEDLEPLARLWHEAWHDAHGGRAPAALAAERGPAHFAAKLPELAPRLFLCGGPGAPEGFAELRQNEVHRLFVARAARSTGVATTLLAEAETRIHAAEFATGKLACLVDNARARRFCERRGWIDSGPVASRIATASGAVTLKSVICFNPLESSPPSSAASGVAL